MILTKELYPYKKKIIFQIMLINIHTDRPTPNREHVESYIKAFYLISDQLEEWVEQSSSKYTAQQLNSLKSLQQATSFVQASSKVEDSTTKQKVFKFIDNFKKQ